MTGESLVACPSCRHKGTTHVGRLPDGSHFAGVKLARPLPGGALYRCPSCKLTFRHPTLGRERYDQLYDNATTTNWATEVIRPDWDRIIEVAKARMPYGGRVLDYGCNTGGLLARLEPGLDRYGVEINRVAADCARARSRAQVWTSMDSIPPGLRFDLIAAVDVVEHLSDPLDLIARLCALLTEDGVLVVTTGDADNRLWRLFGANWWYCYYPEHLAFLSAAWARHACKVYGWRLLRCETLRYRTLPAWRRLVDAVMTVGYGLFPRTYLFLGGWFARLAGRAGSLGPPGSGVSADHLLLMFQRGDATRTGTNA